jgi:hypothetical protein
MCLVHKGGFNSKSLWAKIAAGAGSAGDGRIGVS